MALRRVLEINNRDRDTMIQMMTIILTFGRNFSLLAPSLRDFFFSLHRTAGTAAATAAPAAAAGSGGNSACGAAGSSSLDRDVDDVVTAADVDDGSLADRDVSLPFNRGRLLLSPGLGDVLLESSLPAASLDSVLLPLLDDMMHQCQCGVKADLKIGLL